MSKLQICIDKEYSLLYNVHKQNEFGRIRMVCMPVHDILIHFTIINLRYREVYKRVLNNTQA